MSGSDELITRLRAAGERGDDEPVSGGLGAGSTRGASSRSPDGGGRDAPPSPRVSRRSSSSAGP